MWWSYHLGLLVLHDEQELLILPDHLSSSPFMVLLNLYFSVKYFVDHCLSCCPFSFDHCIACTILRRITASDYPFDIFKPFLDLCTTCCKYDSLQLRGVLTTVLPDIVILWHAAGRWHFLRTLVFFTNKFGLNHKLTNLLLKVTVKAKKQEAFKYSYSLVNLPCFDINA